MDKKLAVVAIPVYKESLEWWEKVSLVQVQRVLGQYDICFFAPQSLHIPYAGKGIRVERFDDACFRDRDAYSRLMLSTDFYERFSDYEYLLLYQLDAFVFSDRLAAFCAMGYDYIGAPIHRHSANWIDIGCNVGNGGFSLRKIASTLRVLKHKEAIFRRRPKAWEKNLFLPCEDLFFSFCSTIPELDFHVPGFLTALEFAVGWDIGHAFARMPAWMPFGCHGWDRNDYRFWKPIMERCGYQLPEPTNSPRLEGRQRRAYRCILHRLLRKDCKYRGDAMEELQTFLPAERPLALWGYGLYGRAIAYLLRVAGREVALIFDRKAAPGMFVEGIPLEPPNFEKMRERNVFVIVATVVYEEEICEELSSHGLEEGAEYGRISVLLEYIVKKVMCAAAKNWFGRS